MNGLRKWLAISLTFSIISILALLFYTITPDQLRSLIQIHPAFLAAALIFQLGSWLVWGARMKTMAEAVGGELSLVFLDLEGTGTSCEVDRYIRPSTSVCVVIPRQCYAATAVFAERFGIPIFYAQVKG